MLSQPRAIFELIFAGLLWGFGFTGAVWALQVMGSLSMTGWRFTLAGLLGAVLFAKNFKRGWSEFSLSTFWPGLLIGLTLVLQTLGLKYTTATKSAFLTCLYVLLVPLLEPFVGGTRPTRRVVIFGAISLIGVALMCGLFADTDLLSDRDAWNIGDLLTVLCATTVSFHILLVGQLSQKLGSHFDSFTFNTYQSFWAGIPCLILALPQLGLESGAYFPTALISKALPLIGFLLLTFGSTFIAFALQIRAQKAIAPSLAALLFLLESPFAAVFAYIFLGERLSPTQLLGGFMIIASIVGAVWDPRPAFKKVLTRDRSVK